MRPKRRGQTASTPVLIGAVTVLVAIIAVFLAYNADNGLPFVPRYTVYVQLRNAAELTHGADVHLGGALVGHVDNVAAARDRAGNPIAVATLALNKSIEPLPSDSRFVVRLKGAIGLKYLEVVPGTSRRGLADGATVPYTQSSAEVDLDQFYGMFNSPTRKGVRDATAGFGYALAGRGGDLNDAIHAFVPLVTDLLPVARNLSSSKTNLAGFFHGLESFNHALVPVAQQQATLYGNLDTTFTALASVAVPFLQNWIHTTPPAFQSLITQGPTIRPFVLDTAALFRALRPGFATLHLSAPVLTQAEIAGIKNLPGTASLDRELTRLAITLRNYGQSPVVKRGLDRLTLTASSLTPPLRYLTPMQSTCNYVTLFLRNTASLLSDAVNTGTTLEFTLVSIRDVIGEESVPSQKAYVKPTTDPNGEIGPVHVDPYPNTASPGQVKECSAGNEPYSGKAPNAGNPPGNVGVGTEKTKAAKS